MELVYLWVEDYKNIKKQGFNFSPRFECSYDEATKELTIDEKKDYVNIFPKNINVTAIVGENGSGKSSIVQCMKKSSVVYFYDDYLYYKEFNQPKNNTRYELKQYSNNVEFFLIEYDLIKYDIIRNFSTWHNHGKIYSSYRTVENGSVNEENFSIKEFGSNLLLKIKEINYVSSIFNFIPKNNDDTIERLADEKGRTYFELSQGERKLYTDMLLIYDKASKSQNENILLLLDEPDLTLHPYWQKKYIKELVNLLSDFPKKKFHVIITSHSPFILSDIPKENVVFLKKDENEKCIDATNETKMDTFGANIHTLLSHGFFMKDGLMGEFAKEKINDAIKYLNQKSLSKEEIDYCENIISIIGEPIIKNQLQKMLDSKRLSKVDKIDKLEEELELIKHRIEIIRKNQ